MHERLLFLNAGVLHLSEWVQGDGGSGGSRGGWRADQYGFPDFHHLVGNAENVGELRAANRRLLLRSREVHARAGAFRIRSRGVCPGAELIIDEHVHRFRKRFPALDVRLRGAQGLFRSEQGEVGVDRGDTDIESGERSFRRRAVLRRARRVHSRSPISEIERLPGEQQSARASPSAAV